MATIRKRGSSWQVQVRRLGFPPLVKTFRSRSDASAWARDKEGAIDRAELPKDQRELGRVTVRSLLDRYEAKITAKKRGADRERYKLRVLRSNEISRATLSRVTGVMVARYRDDRLKAVRSGTVLRELAVLQHCFEVARREWGYPLVRTLCVKSPSPLLARLATGGLNLKRSNASGGLWTAPARSG